MFVESIAFTCCSQLMVQPPAWDRYSFVWETTDNRIKQLTLYFVLFVLSHYLTKEKREISNPYSVSKTCAVCVFVAPLPCAFW